MDYQGVWRIPGPEDLLNLIKGKAYL